MENARIFIENRNERKRVIISMIDIKKETWFFGEDIANCLRYKNPKKALKDNVTDKRKIEIKESDQHNTITVINIYGAYEMISKNKVCTLEQKKCIYNQLTKLCDKHRSRKRRIVSKNKKEFLYKVEKVLEPFGYKCEKYYRYMIGTREVDMYIDNIKLTINYKESQDEELLEKEAETEELIKETLGCSYIRVYDADSDLYNIGLIMKKIMEIA